MTNISAKFTKDTRPLDGLSAIEKELLENPYVDRVVVAVVRPKFSKHDFEEGTEVPTVRVLHIEVVTAGKDEDVARKLLAKAYTERTGADALPLDFDHPVEDLS